MDGSIAAVIISAILGFSATITASIIKRPSGNGDYVLKDVFKAVVRSLEDKMEGYEGWLTKIDKKLDKLLDQEK